MGWPRTILHADLDAFYASAEQLDDPSLRGKPVLVGGGTRGVVCAASYEARAFGCRSAMPMGLAIAKCPHAIVVKPRFDRYAELSARFLAILGEASPEVEPLSLDEAFIDATGSTRLLGDGVAIGRAIRERVRGELGLSCSVGVAPNKFVAKIASDLEKPDALVVIGPEGLAERLAPLPVERMWGVGPVGARRLRAAGLSTFGDLQQVDSGRLRELEGSHAERLAALARGEDDRPVVADREPKSIGHEQTFPEDLTDPDEAEAHLAAQAELVAARLRRKSLKARGVTLKLRFGDFRTVTRARTLDAATDRTDLLRAAAREVFREFVTGGFRPLRLVGFTATRLEGADAPGGQLDLFAELDPGHRRKSRLDRAADAIRARFGKDAIGHADAFRTAGGEPRAGTLPPWNPSTPST
jgi:DNA polymerase-4